MAGQVVVIVIRLASLCCFCLLGPALKVHQHMQAHSASFPLPYSFTVLPFPQNKSNGVGLDCTLSLFPHQQCCLRSACLEMQSSTRGKHNTQSDFYIKTTSACNPTTTMPAATPPSPPPLNCVLPLCCHYDDYQGTLIAQERFPSRRLHGEIYT